MSRSNNDARDAMLKFNDPNKGVKSSIETGFFLSSTATILNPGAKIRKMENHVEIKDVEIKDNEIERKKNSKNNTEIKETKVKKIDRKDDMVFKKIAEDQKEKAPKEEIKVLRNFESKDCYMHGNKLLINQELFNSGLIVLAKKTTNSDSIVIKRSKDKQTHEVTPASFILKDREFAIQHTTAKTEGSIRKNYNLLEKIIGKEALKAFDKNIVVTNKTRREESFTPVLIEDKNTKEKIGSYIYAWLSKNDNDFKFSGFKSFHMAGCLFGSALIGFDGNGYKIPFVKHDIKFEGNQKITQIDVSNMDVSPYELVLTQQIKDLACVIEKLSQDSDQKILHYHLPAEDYVLFGIELFLRGRITFDALDTFIQAIYVRKEEHINQIKNICQQHNIKVKIESPFSSLFDSLNSEELFTATNFFKLMGLSTDEIEPESVSIEQQNYNEKKLVQDCLKKLEDEKLNPSSYKIWQDFVKLMGRDKIVTLEELFKLANSEMVAAASVGTGHNETCSVLPISEKQIQISYAHYVKQQTEYEKKLTQDCLKKLEDEKLNPASYKVWQEFVKEDREKTITYDGLRKFANTKKISHEEIKFIELGNEKKQQLSIDIINEHAKQNGLKHQYQSIVNFTTLDPIISYDPTSHGLLFYCDGYQGALAKLITDTSILKVAQQNIINFITGEKTKSLDDEDVLGPQQIKKATMYLRMSHSSFYKSTNPPNEKSIEKSSTSLPDEKFINIVEKKIF